MLPPFRFSFREYMNRGSPSTHLDPDMGHHPRGLFAGLSRQSNRSDISYYECPPRTTSPGFGFGNYVFPGLRPESIELVFEKLVHQVSSSFTIILPMPFLPCYPKPLFGILLSQRWIQVQKRLLMPVPSSGNPFSAKERKMRKHLAWGPCINESADFDTNRLTGQFP